MVDSQRSIPSSWRVAFSLAGEQRLLVRPIAELLEEALGVGTVFFDEWWAHYLAGNDADNKLQSIYRERSDLVVVCVSADYREKDWTRVEYRAIRALQQRLPDGLSSLRILPLRVGAGDVPGLFDNAIIPDVRDMTPDGIARLILDRMALLSKQLYLAQGPFGDDRPRFRDRLHRFLSNLGWTVRPEVNQTLSAERTIDVMKECRAFVQLVEHTNGEPLDLRSLSEWEQALALELPRFRLRSATFAAETVEPRHQQFFSGPDVMVST
ncbi:MAG: TIR domain-containing protein, partial [Thermoanaerobaculia bacterium]